MTEVGSKRTKRSSSDTDELMRGLQNMTLTRTKKAKPHQPVLSEAEKLQKDLPQDFVVMDGQSRYRKRTQRFTFENASKSRVKPSGEAAAAKAEAKKTKLSNAIAKDTKAKASRSKAKKIVTKATPAKKSSQDSLDSLINAIRNLTIRNGKTVQFRSTTQGKATHGAEPKKPASA